MALPPNVYLSPSGNLWNHIVHFAMLEKTMDFKRLDVDENHLPKDISVVPTLMERNLFIDEPLVILEYLEERFPDPVLMAYEPTRRARMRQLMHTLDVEMVKPCIDIQKMQKNSAHVVINPDTDEPMKLSELQKEMQSRISLLDQIFHQQNYLFDDEFTMLDIMMGPVVWRLESLGLKIPKANRVHEYGNRVFEMTSFKECSSWVQR